MKLFPEDPQGKHRQHGKTARSGPLLVAIFLGLCGGFVLSQQAYLYVQKTKLRTVTPRLLIAGLPGNGDAHEDPSAAAAAADVQSAAFLGIRGDAIPLSTGPPRNELEGSLRIVAPPAPGRPPEVLIAISTYNLAEEGILGTWLDCVLQAGVKNYVVVALDKELRDYLVQRGYNVYFDEMEVDESQANTGRNHGVSALKFKIINEFLMLGYNVFLSDVDIAVFQNPFESIYRDHDIEGMTDGFDDGTAYGKASFLDDVTMGWSRYAQGTEHLNINSGCFYIQANKRTVALMARVAARLAKEAAWDQAIFNHEIFFLSHGDYLSPDVSVRVLEMFKFMNSKVLFKTFRHLPRAQQEKPVLLHLNYHPDKHVRLRAAIQYFLKGDYDALRAFPGGSEPGS